MPRKTKGAAAPQVDRVIDFDAIRQVSRTCQVLDIATVSFSGAVRRPLVGENARELRQKMAFKAARQEGRADIVVSMVDFRFTVANAEDEEVCEIVGVLAVVYSVLASEGSEPLPDHAVDLFAEVNGMYHAWPYVRELVGSCANRLGLGGVVLPIWTPPSIFPPKGEFLKLSSSGSVETEGATAEA